MPRYAGYEIDVIADQLTERFEDSAWVMTPEALSTVLTEILNKPRPKSDAQIAIASAIVDEFEDENGDVKIEDILEALGVFILSSVCHYAAKGTVREARAYYNGYRNKLDQVISKKLKALDERQKLMKKLQEQALARPALPIQHDKELDILFPAEVAE